MAGFKNDVMYADNVDFTGSVAVAPRVLADGQLLIGATVSPNIRVGNLTSTGGTVTITVGAGTINLETTNGGFVWVDQSGTFTAAKNTGYFITGTATANLPASPAQGDTIKFFVDHASQVLTIDAPGTQLIRLGSLVTSAGGTMTSTVQGDSVDLTYRASDTCWCAIGGIVGTWLAT